MEKENDSRINMFYSKYHFLSQSPLYYIFHSFSYPPHYEVSLIPVSVKTIFFCLYKFPVVILKVFLLIWKNS